MKKIFWIITIPLTCVILFLFLKTNTGPNPNPDNRNPREKTFLKYVNNRFIEVEDVFRRTKILVDESRIYLCDLTQSRIYTYSKKNGKRLAVFCSKGEGPAEAPALHEVHIHKENIYVGTLAKIMIFSKDGRLIKEIRGEAAGWYCFPFGDNFVRHRHVTKKWDDKPVITYEFILLDQNLERIKDFFKADFTEPAPKDKNKEPWIFFKDCRKTIVYKDKLYIGFTNLGFSISVFDTKGDACYEIRKDYEKIPVTAKIKKKVHETLKNQYRQHYDDYEKEYNAFLEKQELVFPEHFPAFLNFFIGNDKIYVLKYPRPGSKGMTDLIVMDLRGKVLKKKRFPLFGDLHIILDRTGNYYFYDGKLYLYESLEESTRIHEVDIAGFASTE